MSKKKAYLWYIQESIDEPENTPKTDRYRLPISQKPTEADIQFEKKEWSEAARRASQSPIFYPVVVLPCMYLINFYEILWVRILGCCLWVILCLIVLNYLQEERESSFYKKHFDEYSKTLTEEEKKLVMKFLNSGNQLTDEFVVSPAVKKSLSNKNVIYTDKLHKSKETTTFLQRWAFFYYVRQFNKELPIKEY